MKYWPIVTKRAPDIYDLPKPGKPGAFGTVRKYDVHTGVDLYTWHGAPVRAVEDGTVVEIQPFTGPKADSPWWYDTDAIMIEGESGVICYGEVELTTNLKIGDQVPAGRIIATTSTVLKKDKGKPTCMLHFELYKPGTRDTVWWYHDDPQPESLLDPTPLLVSIMEE